MDSKGFPTKDWALKAKLFIAQFPETPYILSTEKNKYLLSLDSSGKLQKKTINLFEFIDGMKVEAK